MWPISSMESNISLWFTSLFRQKNWKVFDLTMKSLLWPQVQQVPYQQPHSQTRIWTTPKTQAGFQFGFNNVYWSIKTMDPFENRFRTFITWILYSDCNHADHMILGFSKTRKSWFMTYDTLRNSISKNNPKFSFEFLNKYLFRQLWYDVLLQPSHLWWLISNESLQCIRSILCLENSIRSNPDRMYFKVKYFPIRDLQTKNKVTDWSG